MILTIKPYLQKKDGNIDVIKVPSLIAVRKTILKILCEKQLGA